MLRLFPAGAGLQFSFPKHTHTWPLIASRPWPNQQGTCCLPDSGLFITDRSAQPAPKKSFTQNGIFPVSLASVQTQAEAGSFPSGGVWILVCATASVALSGHRHRGVCIEHFGLPDAELISSLNRGVCIEHPGLPDIAALISCLNRAASHVFHKGATH